MAETTHSIPVLHEDLSDELSMVLAPETVYTSMVKAGKPATNSKFGAPADKPQKGRLGGVGETRSVDRTAVVDRFASRAKVEGVVQQFREDYGVSTRVRMVDDPAGVADLAAEADLRAQEAFKLDLEQTSLSQQVPNEDAYVLNEKGTLEHQMLTGGASFYAKSGTPLGSLPIPSAFRPASALNVAVSVVTDFTESSHRTFLKNKWDGMNGRATDTMVFCTSDFQHWANAWFDKADITGSTQMATRSFKWDGPVTAFDYGLVSYKTTFGKTTFIPTTQLNAVRNSPANCNGGTALTGATTNTSTTVVVNSSLGLQPFMLIAGTNIPAGAYIASITDATHIVISAAATGTASGTALTLGDYDHALFLEMDHFQKKVNGGILNHDLSPDGSGTQGYVEGFYANFCSLGTPQGRVFTANS